MRDFISKYTAGKILVIFGLLGIAVIWISSPWGIGVGYDSIFYLSASDNILSGSGLSRFDGYGNTIPLTHFPPLYSLTLAGFSLITGFESDLAARILAAVFFGFLVGLSGWLVYRHTRSLLASVVGSTFVLVSPVLLDVSFMAMSELLFLVLLLLMIDFLNKYLLHGNMVVLIIAAIFASLMYLTR
ncbi:MAG: glycosyltransferase family 39 protein, partial [Anaerolineales bacterium]|nr:glycosyltransferase family 39 protein [Anaerolineales bacterium]